MRLSSIWCFPNTVLGYLVAWSSGCLRARTVDGVAIFIALGWLKWYYGRTRFNATTFGEVIIFRDHGVAMQRFSMRHEMEHVRQYRRLGPFFLIAYGAASLISVLRGYRAYDENYFEIKAREAERDENQISG